MNQTFRPGQLVECIDDQLKGPVEPNENPTLNGLKKGRIYTIRWAGNWGSEGIPNAYNVRLEEIRDRYDWVRSIADMPYFAFRFRPVDDRRLDVFRQMLVRKQEAA